MILEKFDYLSIFDEYERKRSKIQASTRVEDLYQCYNTGKELKSFLRVFAWNTLIANLCMKF